MIYDVTPSDFSSKLDVVACYVEHNSEILLLLRQDHKPQPNTWCLPAGKIDARESKTDAMLRELREETGIALSHDRIRFYRSIPVRYPQMDFMYHLFHTKLDARPGIILSANEHKAHQWVTPRKSLELPLIPDEDACIKLFYKL